MDFTLEIRRNDMNIVRFNSWNPIRELDQVFDRYLLPVTGSHTPDAHDWSPAVDIRETDKAYRVDLELPAIDPKDVNVTLKDGVLQVSGERQFAEDDDERDLNLIYAAQIRTAHTCSIGKICAQVHWRKEKRDSWTESRKGCAMVCGSYPSYFEQIRVTL